jgi:hypothetical protein
MADKSAAESREQMTEPRLTEAQYKAAYKAWMDVRTRIDDSSRAVIAAIAEHVQYPSEAAQEPRYTLDETLGPVTDEEAVIACNDYRECSLSVEDSIEFAVNSLINNRRARLSPAPPDRAVEAIQAMLIDWYRNEEKEIDAAKIVAAVRQADAKTEETK